MLDDLYPNHLGFHAVIGLRSLCSAPMTKPALITNLACK